MADAAVERAVLQLWPRIISGQPNMLGCRLCGSRPTYYKAEQDFQHLPDCVVPPLIVKYRWYEEVPTWNVTKISPEGRLEGELTPSGPRWDVGAQ